MMDFLFFLLKMQAAMCKWYMYEISVPMDSSKEKNIEISMRKIFLWNLALDDHIITNLSWTEQITTARNLLKQLQI